MTKTPVGQSMIMVALAILSELLSFILHPTQYITAGPKHTLGEQYHAFIIQRGHLLRRTACHFIKVEENGGEVRPHKRTTHPTNTHRKKHKKSLYKTETPTQ